MDKNMQLFEQNNNSPKVKCQKCRRYIGMCMYIYTQTYARVLCVSLFEEKKKPKEEDGQKKMCPPAVPLKREKYTLSRAYSTCVSV